jgi:hypothetical protein
MRRRLAGARVCFHGKFVDGSISRDGSVSRRGKSDDRSGCCNRKLYDGIIGLVALRRGRHDRERAGDLRGIGDGISAVGFVDGSRLVRRPGWNSAGLYRNGRGRAEPSIRCAEPQSVGAYYGLADASRRHGPALDSIGNDRAERNPMPPDNADRYPYDPGGANRVRTASGGARPGPSIDEGLQLN